MFILLHPVLVHFTCALVPCSWAADVVGRVSRSRSLQHAGAWTLAAAAVATPIAAVVGWTWWFSMDRPHDSYMIAHEWIGTSLAVLLLPLAAWRLRDLKHDRAPGWAFLGLFAALLLATMAQGHLGGVHVYAPESIASADPAGT